MIKRDYYEVLSVERDADLVKIKKSYRKIALECHPDRCGGDKDLEKRFKEASEAYEVLSDNQKRGVYDQYGHNGLSGQGFHGFDNVNDIFSSFGSVFEEFFGMGFGGNSRRAQAGNDVGFELTINFMDAMEGIEKEIEINKAVKCGKCNGTGVPEEKQYDVCKACQGSGHVTVRQGFFVMQTTCPECGGRGNSAKCDECHGKGVLRKKRKISVKVPPGVEDGIRLVLRGEGDASAEGGQAGDLYVLVHVKSDKRFQRRAENLYTVIKISFPQAALGCKVNVPVLKGEEEMKIQSGIQSGEEIRLKGKGAPRLHHGGHGDIFVKVIVETPKKISRKQKKLLEDFLKEK